MDPVLLNKNKESPKEALDFLIRREMRTKNKLPGTWVIILLIISMLLVGAMCLFQSDKFVTIYAAGSIGLLI